MFFIQLLVYFVKTRICFLSLYREKFDENIMVARTDQSFNEDTGLNVMERHIS